MPVSAATNRTRRRDLILLGVAVIVAVILAAVLLVRHVGADDAVTPPPSDVGSAAKPPPPVATAPQLSLGPLGDLARRHPDDPLAQGSVTAPIVLIEFADMRCPFCAQFSRQTEPVLIKRYVDTGLLRIEWRDLAIFGPPVHRCRPRRPRGRRAGAVLALHPNRLRRRPTQGTPRPHRGRAARLRPAGRRA